MHALNLRTCLATLAITALASLNAGAQTSAASATWNTFASQSERPSTTAPQGLAKLVLLRPPSPQDATFPADILIDGRYLTSLLPGGFAEAQVCPGSRLLEMAGQGTSGLNFRPRLPVLAQLEQTTYIVVQAPSAKSPMRSDLNADEANVLLKDLRRQSHAVSRVLPPLSCPTPAPEAPAQTVQIAPPPPPPPPLPALPAPVLPSAPEPKPPKRYTLSAEMLFAFGGSQPKHLAERGRREIMALAKQLQEDLQASDVVLVQGHTDPTGSAGLNQRLSAERADTVRGILLSQGIPARQVRAQGLGSSELLVKDCALLHPKRDARIACDLPNRRVEITVAPSKN